MQICSVVYKFIKKKKKEQRKEKNQSKSLQTDQDLGDHRPRHCKDAACLLDLILSALSPAQGRAWSQLPGPWGAAKYSRS